MKRILLVGLLLLSLILCLNSLALAFFWGDDHDFEGMTAFEKGNFDEAIRIFTKDIESGKLSQSTLAMEYLHRGMAWNGKGDYDKAIADFTKAIEIEPKDLLAYWSRGVAWNGKGDYDKAIADFTKAIEIDPKFVLNYSSRAEAWEQKGNYDKAIADYTKLITIAPKDVLAYFRRGSVWLAKRDYGKAVADYTKTIEINPKVVEAYILRGASWEAKGDYDKAIADFTKAIEIDPKAVEAYNGLAWLLATCRNDRYRDGKRAVALAEKAVKLEEAANRLDTLAAAYAEAGRFQEAIKTQERAITRIKQSESWAGSLLPEYEKHLLSYKAGKSWREK